MFAHVLIATDFSPPAMLAAQTAHDVAKAFGAKLTLMHVFDPDGGSLAAAAAADNLQVLRDARFPDFDNVEVVKVPHRRADIAICEQALARGADLIVAGRHGLHRLGERLLGSTTERVVRHAHCSVWVDHPAKSEVVTAPKHILAGTDLSRESECAVDVAGALARRFESWVTLMHVYDLFPPVELLQEPYAERQDHSFTAVATAKVEALRKDKLDAIPAETLVLRDKSAVTALCDFASDKEVGLIVLGTHGMTGVRRLLVGSIAERVVRHAPCSALVVRKAG